MCPSSCVINQLEVYANVSPSFLGHVCEMLGCCFRNKDGLFHVHERTVLCPPGRQFCFDTPKNLLGEQSHRHKPRVPNAETQRAQVHPTPSVSTKVLPSAEPDVQGHISMG